jgi:spore germination protein GerM
MFSSHRHALRLLTTFAAATLVLTACGSKDNSSGSGSTSSSASTSSTATAGSTATTSQRTTSIVQVYLIKSEKLIAASRTLSGTASPASALEALMKGPQGALEHDLQMSTQIPDGTVLHSAEVQGDTATVDVSESFESGGGSFSMQARVAQIVFTATRFPGVTQVKFEIDGTPVRSVGGEGVMVDGVGRADFTDMAPIILVDAPGVGQVVSSPLRVAGMSNTFEATVNYTLTDPDGRILEEGFTTASAGTGTWGTFAFEVAFDISRNGYGELIVYEISPRDGSRVNVMEIPLQMNA